MDSTCVDSGVNTDYFALISPPPARAGIATAVFRSEIRGHEFVHRNARQSGVPVRLRHRRRHRHDSAGTERRRHSCHLGQEGRAGLVAGLAAQGLQALAHDEGAALAERLVYTHRLPGAVVLLRPEVGETAAVAR